MHFGSHVLQSVCECKFCPGKAAKCERAESSSSATTRTGSDATKALCSLPWHDGSWTCMLCSVPCCRNVHGLAAHMCSLVTSAAGSNSATPASSATSAARHRVAVAAAAGGFAAGWEPWRGPSPRHWRSRPLQQAPAAQRVRAGVVPPRLRATKRPKPLCCQHTTNGIHCHWLTIRSLVCTATVFVLDHTPAADRGCPAPYRVLFVSFRG
jgi:hypothetical protein